MNAYMACCCEKLPCGEIWCDNGGIFVCGTYTFSIAAEETYTHTEDPCCGHAGGLVDESKTVDAYQRTSVSFKAILRNNGNGDTYSAGGENGFGNYLKYSIRASGSGRVDTSRYSDSSSGCPNDPGPSRVSRSSFNKEINVSEQEDPFGSYFSMILSTSLFDCSDSNQFLTDNCLYEYYQIGTCLQRLQIRASAIQLAEAAFSGSEYLFQFGQVQIDESSSGSEEYLWSTGEYESNFYRAVSPSGACAENGTDPFFDLHVLSRICAPTDPTNDRCNCQLYGLPCEAHTYDTPKPLESYGIFFLDPLFGEYISAYADAVPCSLNTLGMVNSVSAYNNYNYSTGCYGAGTCNDEPGPLPGAVTNQNENKSVEIDYALTITKWEYIPYANLPPIGPNWDEGLSCV